MADGQKNTGVVIVALPAADHPVNSVSSEGPAHMTLAFLGDQQPGSPLEDPERLAMLQSEVAAVAGTFSPGTDRINGRGTLGPNGADVLLVDASAMVAVQRAITAMPNVAALSSLTDQHPTWIPHVTLGYPETPALGDPAFEDITFDRLALWAGDTRTEFAIGGPAPDAPTADGAPSDPVIEDPIANDAEASIEPIPWHGILTVEATPSGDGRTFAAGSLRERQLPLPLQYVKAAGEGHTGAVVVGRIDRIEHEGNLIWGFGVFNSTPEADEAIGMLADRSIRGVSVDVDDATFEQADAEQMVITDGRIAGATLCAIPAFEEAYISLGTSPADSSGPKTGQPPIPVAADDELDAELVALVAAAELEFAPGTHDGPGWITNPRATSRIRRYWVHGKGAAKIKWGAPHDFYRCRNQLRKYVQNPEWLNGLCANMHKEALGVWPGQEAASGVEVLANCEDCDTAPMLSLVASAGQAWLPPGGLFQNPHLTEETALTIEKVGDDLHIYGHAFTWDACHTAYADLGCVSPPPSPTNYSRYLAGSIATTLGEQLVGQITVGIPHAGQYASPTVAMAHYDNTTSAVADVAFGDDEIGGWFSGAIRPWAKPELLHELRASGVVSGDWRDFGQGLDLIAVLGVNVGGFNTMRAKAGVRNQKQVSLVAAGMVVPRPEPSIDTLVASAVAAELARREASQGIIELTSKMRSPSERILLLSL